MRDRQEYERQREWNQTDDYFKRQAEERERSGRQKLKRAAAVQKVFENLVGSRVEPGASGSIEVIKDERYLELTRMYQRAVAKGEHKQCEFQPVGTYQQKVSRARPILKGEVGMIGSKILRLEVGYGEGAVINVPKQLEPESDRGFKIYDADGNDLGAPLEEDE